MSVRAAGGRRTRLGLAAATLLLLGVSGCSPVYVMRAGYEQAKILWRRQPITAVLAQPAISSVRRHKLELVLQVRAFAEQLGLEVGGNYASLVELDRNQMVYVVAAAERLRLEPYTWWFPIVGRVPYKGFFRREDAQGEVERLQAAGYDTLMRSAVAFSTLGWFDDPLTSNLLDLDDGDLANVVIHELLHTTRYYPGYTAFAESFANFVGSRGAIEFFTARGDHGMVARLSDDWRASLAYSNFLARLVAELRRAYDAGITLDQRRELLARAEEELAAAGIVGHRRIAGSLNNAILLQELMYYDRLPEFEQLWQRSGDRLALTVSAVLAATAEGGDPFVALGELLATTAAP